MSGSRVEYQKYRVHRRAVLERGVGCADDGDHAGAKEWVDAEAEGKH